MREEIRETQLVNLLIGSVVKGILGETEKEVVITSRVVTG